MARALALREHQPQHADEHLPVGQTGHRVVVAHLEELRRGLPGAVAHLVQIGLLMAHRPQFLPHGNPVNQVRKPKEPKGRDRRLEAGEEELILAELTSTPLVQSIVSLAIETAMRRSELVGIQWKDINLDEATIHLRATSSKTHREWFIPIAPALRPELENLLLLTTDRITRAPRGDEQVFNRLGEMAF